MTFGKRLVDAREKMGLNQKQLAELLSITPTRLNYWEKDKRQPDVPMIKALATVLHVSSDFLIGNDIVGGKSVKYSDNALRIATDYDSLDAHGQRMVRIVADEEKRRMELEDKARKEREAMEAGMIAPPTPTPPIASQPYPELDLTAQVAKLERQNQELAAEIAAMREQERKAPQEMTDEELRMELDRQLLEEKNRAENGVVSGPTNSDTATG